MDIPSSNKTLTSGQPVQRLLMFNSARPSDRWCPDTCSDTNFLTTNKKDTVTNEGEKETLQEWSLSLYLKKCDGDLDVLWHRPHHHSSVGVFDARLPAVGLWVRERNTSVCSRNSEMSLLLSWVLRQYKPWKISDDSCGSTPPPICLVAWWGSRGDTHEAEDHNQRANLNDHRLYCVSQILIRFPLNTHLQRHSHE